jgi:hypothetical protein
VRFVNSKPLDDLESHGIIEFAKIENGVPEQLTFALQVSDIWHKIKGQIWPSFMEVTIWEGGEKKNRVA